MATAQQTHTEQHVQDLTKLGIEDLMNIQVTTASKEAQSLSHVPAAIYVVTQEDIRRSGATCVPEALRGVPGVQVARVNASQWIVSIRGFNIRFADKILVLVDGRSVYDPLFSGVFWDQLEVNMDDIERIEVIRGPGGSLWGANAVNGIINIITKQASDTQGTTAKLSGSTGETDAVMLEHGGKLAPNAFYRVYAKYFNVDSFPSPAGGNSGDSWHGQQGGFRTDWSTKSDAYTVSGGLNNSRLGQTSNFPTLTPPYQQIEVDRFPASNWDVLAHWERTAGSSKGTSIQVAFDHMDRMMPEAGERRDTFRIDFQKPLAASSRNRVIWGLGYVYTKDKTFDTRLTDLEPSDDLDQVFSGFIQDELSIARNVQLSLGTKIEHNDTSGWEIQPSGRLTWQKNEKETFWASISRAVRTPNRVTDEVIANVQIIPPMGGNPFPVEIRVFGNPKFKSEVVVAHEIGWRYVPSGRFSLDATAYLNRYDNLFSLEPGTPFFENAPVPHMVLPLTYGNGLNAVTGGVELASQYQMSPAWRLKSSATIFSARYFLDAGSHDANSNPEAERQGCTPQFQFTLASELDLARHLQFDTNFHYVDRVRVGQIAPYGRLDLRLGWKPRDGFECSFGVQNLLTTRHREAFSSFIDVPALIQRNLYLTATFKF